MGNSEHSLLSFQVSPVQPFIESARTLRDLWSGSFLLSWIVGSAMKPIYDHPDCKKAYAFITPQVDLDSNALLDAILKGRRGDENAVLPTIPNKFVAKIPSDLADQLRTKCLEAAQAAWRKIANDVRKALNPEFDKRSDTWARYWDNQVGSYFEFHSVVKPIKYPDQWNREREELVRLSDMSRSVRHVPAYAPNDDGPYPPKCSLLGTFEQMGPGELGKSREFWESLTFPKWDGLQGTTLQKADRLCAISLVKRFAWPVDFFKQLGLDPQTQRYSDTATIAAAVWLQSAGIDPKAIRRQFGCWNGQWLHWGRRDENTDEEPCPEDVFGRIENARRPKSLGGHGKPPRYYAIIHLDGDNMGELFKGADIDNVKDLTARLTQFAGEVKKIVDGCNGELIYCGGDDILILISTEKTVECAEKLRTSFASEKFMGKKLEHHQQAPKASLSGGIAVVHYKEDLRYALKVVRDAEKVAKSIDKQKKHKNALAIAVCRHSGEHSMAVMGCGATTSRPWTLAEKFQQLIGHYRDGASDRWTYKLRELLPVLCEMDRCLECSQAETQRLLDRLQESSKKFKDDVMQFFKAYAADMQGEERNWKQASDEKEIVKNFVTLCQSAAFMARGKE